MMYIPALDPYGAVYRMLHILNRLGPEEVMEVDRLRIFDFYLLFPDKALRIRMRTSESALKALLCKRIGERPVPYCVVTNDRRLFERMRPYQMIALHRLAAYGLICPQSLLAGKVRVSDAAAMRRVMGLLDAMSHGEANMLSWLCLCFRNTPLTGHYGLKYRTQLMEYKYDTC